MCPRTFATEHWNGLVLLSPGLRPAPPPSTDFGGDGRAWQVGNVSFVFQSTIISKKGPFPPLKRAFSSLCYRRVHHLGTNSQSGTCFSKTPVEMEKHFLLIFFSPFVCVCVCVYANGVSE